jgi:hypothetical protein
MPQNVKSFAQNNVEPLAVQVTLDDVAHERGISPHLNNPRSWAGGNISGLRRQKEKMAMMRGKIQAGVFKCGLALAAAAVCALAAPSAAAVNVLANPSFDQGTAAGNADANSAAGWTFFGNTFNVSTPNPQPVGPHSGTGALKEFGTFPGVSGAFQSFATTPGTTWSLTGFGLNASSDAMQADNFGTLKISFQDAGNNELLGIDSNHITINTPQNLWTAMSAQGTAPAGTTHVNLFALFVQPNFNGGSTFFDDLSGTVVPEPAAMTLAIFAGSLTLARRRRA